MSIRLRSHLKRLEGAAPDAARLGRARLELARRLGIEPASLPPVPESEADRTTWAALLEELQGALALEPDTPSHAVVIVRKIVYPTCPTCGAELGPGV